MYLCVRQGARGSAAALHVFMRFSFGAGRPIIRKKEGREKKRKERGEEGEEKKEEEKERKKYNGHVNPTPSQREGQ